MRGLELKDPKLVIAQVFLSLPAFVGPPLAKQKYSCMEFPYGVRRMHMRTIAYDSVHKLI